MLDLITKGFAKMFGTKSERDIKEIRPIVEAIHAETAKVLLLSDEELRGQTAFLKSTIQDRLQSINGEIDALRAQVADNPEMDLDAKEGIFNKVDKLIKDRLLQLEAVLKEVLPLAFAVVKETARRLKENGKLEVEATPFDREIAARRAGVVIENDRATWLNRWTAAGNEVVWDMVHYDVQLIGGIVLHSGKIAEMATGEGKTLVATLPTYLNALAGFGVHIVTVNDYLAKRDSEWMSPIFEFHGLRVDCIDKHESNTQMRRNAYLADITYGTNNEFGFDYLRDNMTRYPEELVQRKHHYAMVDEVDSVLIDDARTPLIISGPVAADGEEQEYFDLKPRVTQLVDAQRKLVQGLLSEAKEKLAKGEDEEGSLALFRAYRGLPEYKPVIKFLSETGMKQKMQKTENHFLQDNAREMPQADKILYFTIDKKHNSVDLTDNGIVFLTQKSDDTAFFVLPDLGLEIAKIEQQKDLVEEQKLIAKEKLNDDYFTKSRRVHAIQQLLKAYTLFEKDVDYVIMDEKVKIVDEQTGRVLDGRRYSDGLHQALEAKESVKIEEATQTYATVTLQNYFRMYHKLAGMTGTAETEATEFYEIYKLDVVVIPTNKPTTRKDEEDMVYKTTREKFNAVVEEVQRLTSQNRPVLVGTTSVENSELLSRMLSMRKVPHQVLNAKQHAKEADIVAEAGKPATVTIATNMAGRGTDIKLTAESRAAGGLAIIGTERHESRRVDRQLRGRAGRQGDPGTSQFFVSLEDGLMRMFGSDRIASIMDRIGLKEGEVIQHSMITKSIERAQRKVEENNFGMRKRLLEYDDVMNAQREVIYRRRRNALFGERLDLDIMNMFYDVAESVVSEGKSASYDFFKLEAHTVFGITSAITQDEFDSTKTEALAQRLYDEVYHNLIEKNRHFAEIAYPAFEDIRKNHGAVVKEIGMTFTDGKRRMQLGVDLVRGCETQGREVANALGQGVVLSFIDQFWKEHLREMDDLRQQVQFATLEQKDPLLIYKFEAFKLFRGLVGSLNNLIVSFLAKAGLASEDEEEAMKENTQTQRAQQKKQKLIETKDNIDEPQAKNGNAPQAPPRQVEVTRPMVSQKIHNRNDKVTVQYNNGTVKKDVKFKSVEEDLKNNLCVVIG